MRRVWGRMQQYPHCFELAAARGELASLNMDGTPCDGPAPVASVGRFSFFGWKVDVADVEDYLADGALSESLLQALLLLLRDRWPQNAYVFGPHLVRTRKVSLTLPQRRGGTCPKESSLPEISCFPYRTVKSKHWVLYVRVKVGTAPAKLVLFKRDTVPAAALATSNEYMESFFNLSLEERALPSVAFTDLAVLFACAEAMTDVPFETVQATAAKTVDATASFCKTLLTESAATRCADLLELTASAPTLGDFVRSFFDVELPSSHASAELLPRRSSEPLAPQQPVSCRQNPRHRREVTVDACAATENPASVVYGPRRFSKSRATTSCETSPDSRCVCGIPGIARSAPNAPVAVRVEAVSSAGSFGFLLETSPRGRWQH